MLAIFVGQSMPAGTLRDRALFESTMTGRRILRWIEQIIKPGDEVVLLDACHEGGQWASKEELWNLDAILCAFAEEGRPYELFAFGRVAAETLERLERRFFRLPHPAARDIGIVGLNHVHERLKEARALLHPSRLAP